MLGDENPGRHRRAAQRGTGEVLGNDENGEDLARVQGAAGGDFGLERHHRKRRAAAQTLEDLLGESNLTRRAGRALIEIDDAQPHGADRGLRVDRAGKIEENEDRRD